MRITALLTILCWMVLFVACPTKNEEKKCHTPLPMDSLIRLGDSAIRSLSDQRAQTTTFIDSLHSSINNLSTTTTTKIYQYKTKLEEKEYRKAIIKDTTIYTYKYDTIFNQVQVTVLDTVHRDTVVYRSIFKRKLF